MHRRWLAAILLFSLLVGISAAVPAITSLASAALVWQVRWADDPAGVAGSASPPGGSMPVTPPRTMQDLAHHLAALAGVAEGRHTPVEVVQIADKEYLILIAGTRFEKRPFGTTGGNTLESAIQQVTKQPSAYQRRVEALITQHIPVGSRLHLVGQSLGGMVANSLAATHAHLDHYRVATVTTFGTPVNACPNPAVAYHRYVVEGDPVPLVHRAAIWSRIKGPLRVLEAECAGGYAYLEQTLIDHSPGPYGLEHAHSSYDQSQDLSHKPLPFQADRFESLGRFTAEP